MADDNTDDEPDDDEDEDRPPQTESRDRELADDKPIRDACLKLYPDLEKGFSDQWERANSTMDYWDIYNCELSAQAVLLRQFQDLPADHSRCDQRARDPVRQPDIPAVGQAHRGHGVARTSRPRCMSLLEFYIRKAKLRTSVMPPLLRNGDIEGQYNIEIGWVRNKRHVAMRGQEEAHSR